MPASAAEVAILLSAKDQASQVIQKLTGDMDKLGASSAGLGENLKGAGTAIAGIAATGAVTAIAGVGAALGASVSAAANFEQAMSAISAVSGASAGEMEALQQAALDLGKSTSCSATEAAAGIEELVKAGVSISDVLSGGAAASLDLAAAGAVSVAEAAEIASNAINIFGNSGSEMSGVADTIAGAVNSSAIGMNDYKFSLAAAGAVAATVGVGFEDLSTAIALLGNSGLKGSDAGTSLKTMLMNLSPTSNCARDAMRELGITAEDGSNAFFTATGSAKSRAEIAEVLQNALKDLTKEQQLNALEAMFGSDAIRAAAIMAEAGAEGFTTLAESIGKVTAKQVASERLNNLKGAMGA